MAVQLFGKNSRGIIESGWFEPEDSRQKRANGWVTSVDKLPKEEEPEVKELDVYGSDVAKGVQEQNDKLIKAIKELDKPEEIKPVKKEIKKPKKSRKKTKK